MRLPQQGDAWYPVTMREVAEEIGVHPSTVSRVLNQAPGVGEATRRKVREAVERLGYHRNWAARHLIKQRAEAIGVVIPRASKNVFGNPYYFELLQGICERARAAGHRILLDIEPDTDYGRSIKNAHADGLIVVHPEMTDPRLIALAAERIPTVVIGVCIELDLPFVEIDNEGGFRALVDHLWETGRRQIALVTGPERRPSVIEQTTGYRLALARRGVDVGPERIVSQPLSGKEGGLAGIKELLARGVPFDAVVAKNDVMALGVLEGLAAAGLSVPADVAVTGFDGIELGRHIRPSLTTIEQPTAQKAGTAVELLLSLIAGEPLRQRSMRMSGRLLVGESSGAGDGPALGSAP